MIGVHSTAAPMLHAVMCRVVVRVENAIPVAGIPAAQIATVLLPLMRADSRCRHCPAGTGRRCHSGVVQALGHRNKREVFPPVRRGLLTGPRLTIMPPAGRSLWLASCSFSRTGGAELQLRWCAAFALPCAAAVPMPWCCSFARKRRLQRCCCHQQCKLQLLHAQWHAGCPLGEC